MDKTGAITITLLCLLQLYALVQAGPDADTPRPAATAGHVLQTVVEFDADGTRGLQPTDYQAPEPPHYDGYASNECEDGCPKPQPADAVDDAYITHLTFNWADLAQELALDRSKSGAAQGRRQGTALVIPFRSPPKSKGGKATPSSTRAVQQQHVDAQPATWAEGQQAAQAEAQPATQAEAQPAAQGAGQPATAAKGQPATQVEGQQATAAGAESDVHPAAVIKEKFLLPTGEKESGQGFAGTVDYRYIPTDQALAVGPHPTKTGAVMVVHGINSAVEFFAATKDGKKLPLSVPTKILLADIMQRMGYPNGNQSLVSPIDPTAFYDKAEGRYVITWGSAFYAPSIEGDGSPPLFVCVSADNQPLDTWTCWALSSITYAQPYARYCAGNPPSEYIPDYPQSSYSDNGIFVTVGGFCGQFSFLSTLFAFSKKALYSTPPPADRRRTGAAGSTASSSTPVVMRATYLPSGSWYLSLPEKDQLLDFEPENVLATNPFNAFVLPSRPQSVEDVPEPFFVMGKVDGNNYMSIAKLTAQSLSDMTSRKDAPRIYATVLRKPNFANTDGFPGGDAVIPQPENGTPLDAGEVGAYGRTYGATHHNGRVYVATTEFFGMRNTRVPSIYYAIINPSSGLCKARIHKHGMVASKDGFALAFPVIAARDDGAVLGYSYGSAGSIELNGVTNPAYAGFAKTTVGCKGVESVIQVVKRGQGVVPQYSTGDVARWGDFSAIDFVDNVAWFAGCVALPDAAWYGSWISTQQL